MLQFYEFGIEEVQDKERAIYLNGKTRTEYNLAHTL